MGSPMPSSSIGKMQNSGSMYGKAVDVIVINNITKDEAETKTTANGEECEDVDSGIDT